MPPSYDAGGSRSSLYYARLSKLTQVAILANPNNPGHTGTVRALEAGAVTLGLKTDLYESPTLSKFEEVITALTRNRPQAMFVIPDFFLYSLRDKIIEFAAGQRIPTAYALREYALAGGLLAIGADRQEMYRRAAFLMHKVFVGLNPGDIPIEQPTKFELLVSLKTAKALGLTIPPSLLLRADQVIE